MLKFAQSYYLVIVVHSFLTHTPLKLLSTLCDVISFNGQGQLSALTCAE